MVVWSEDDGKVPHCCLGEVMDACAEAASYVDDIAVFIYGAEQSEAVDDEYFGIGECLQVACGELGVAQHSSALQQLHDHLDMALGNDMGREDEFPVAMLVEVGDENLLVREP